MPSISKVTGLQRERIKTLGRISVLTPLLLTHLVENNNLSLTRLTKKTKTNKKIFVTIVDKNKVEVKTLL